MKRSPAILLFLLAVVTGIYLFLKYRPVKKEDSEPSQTPNPYLINRDEAAGDIISIQIRDSQGNAVLITKSADDLWSVKKPTFGLADTTKMTMLSTQLYALGIEGTLDAAIDPSNIGFQPPAFTVDVKYSDGMVITFDVGEATPSGNSYYTRMDGKIYMISQYNIEAIINLLKDPPYIATPTAIFASETATSVSTKETEKTPTPTNGPDSTPSNQTPTP
jgi:hypothetical protein